MSGLKDVVVHLFGYIANEDVEGVIEIVSYRENRNILQKRKNFPLYKRIEVIVKILKGLIQMKESNIHHGSLHPRNILMDEANHPRLADTGYAFVKHFKYEVNDYEDKPFYSEFIDRHYTLQPDKLKQWTDQEKEAFDVYSIGKVLLYLTKDVTSDSAHHKLEDELKDELNCFGDDLSKRCHLEDLYHFLQNSEKMSFIYGEVDAFWNSLKDEVKDNKISFAKFAEHFYHFFNNTDHLGEKERRESIEYIENFIHLYTDNSDQAENIGEEYRSFLALNHILRVEKKKVLGGKEELVTRDNYSMFFSLCKDVLYTSNQKNSFSSIAKFFKELYGEKFYWYGFLSVEEAENQIRNSVLTSKKCLIIAYAPIEKRGTFLFKVKLSIEAASNENGKRVIDSPDYQSFNFPTIFTTSSDYCEKLKKQNGKVSLFGDDTVTYTNPGASLGLRNIKSGYGTQGSKSIEGSVKGSKKGSS